MHAEIKLTLLLASGVLLCPAANAVKAPHALSRPRVVPGEILVKYRGSASQKLVRQSLGHAGLSGEIARGGNKPKLLVLDKDQSARKTLKALRRDPTVEYAERIYYRYPQALDRAVPNDPDFPKQWGWNNPGTRTNSIADADLDMPEAWGILRRAPDIRVAIIDDGFDLNHDDLAGNFVATGGVSCIKGDCTTGATAALQDKDKEFHGTLVAGVLGAVGDNGIGISGSVWSLNVLPIRTDLRSDSLASAIRYAVDHNATIINISLGGPGYTNNERDAIDYARRNGVLIVTSAGNHDANIDDSVLAYPANYNRPNIIVAAASNRRDGIASFSQWGSFAADVAAPGVDIMTTAVGGGYSVASGTSFSSPAVAGVAALVAQHLKNETGVVPDYRAIKAHLLAGAEFAGASGQGNLKGRTAAGRVNAYQALQDINGGVLVIKNVTIDDNNNDEIDPGESFTLDITVVNDWQGESDVRGTLKSLNRFTTAAPNARDFGAIGEGATMTAAFPVTAGAFTGNHHLLFELDLSTTSGKSAKRYFYLNIGVLTNNITLTQTMQRTNWDEFQAFHVTVPAGGSDLVIYTRTDNNIDIDLLARYGKRPEYDIALGARPGSDAYEFYVDNDPAHPEGHTKVSGNNNGDESIAFAANTKPGAYHIVAVNFAGYKHPYRITACYAPPGSDQASLTGINTEIDGDDGVVTLKVTRSGTVGVAAIDYATQGGAAAAGTNYETTAGTLHWADGENATRTITVPIMDTGKISDSAASFKRFRIVLSNPTGVTLGCIDETTVTLTGAGATDTSTKPMQTPPPTSPPPADSDSEGGGGVFGLLFTSLLCLLVLRYRRP